MATYQTYQAIGNREDLTDIITNISPVDTWFTSNSGSANAKATYHEWQTDSLASAAANAQVEGAAVTAGTVSPTTRAGNYTQILQKVFQVSYTQEAVDSAGRKSEIAYQTEKHLKEMAKDIEYALLLNGAAASGASGTARTLGGVYGYLSGGTNVDTGTATGLDLDETRLNDALQKVWASGGFPQTVICGAFQKRKISSFTTNTRYMVADTNKVASAIDIYQSDFGTVEIRLHHQVNTTVPEHVFIFGDMNHWVKAWLRGVNRMKEPYAGDAELWAIRGELTLESRQEAGHGFIADLSTS